MKRTIVFLVLLVTLSSLAGTATAGPIDPPPKALKPFIRTVFNDLVRFWGVKPPPLIFYHDGSPNRQVPACRTTTRKSWGTMGFYCPGDNTLYLDMVDMTNTLKYYGKGAVALWVAHEYGHRIQAYEKISLRPPYHELMADCLAGTYFSYTEHHTLAGGSLTLTSALEATVQLQNLDLVGDPNPDGNVLIEGIDVTHGMALQRLKAFVYGLGTQRVPAGLTAGNECKDGMIRGKYAKPEKKICEILNRKCP